MLIYNLISYSYNLKYQNLNKISIFEPQSNIILILITYYIVSGYIQIYTVMSTVQVEYNNKVFTYTVANSSVLINELYNKACQYHSINRLCYKLIVNHNQPRHSNKHVTVIDRSQPIRYLLTQKHTKLLLVEQLHHNDLVHITIDYNHTTIQLNNTHYTTSLYDILIKLEQPPYNYTLFDVHGIPPVDESNTNYTVHINIPGLLQPTIEYNQRKYGLQLNHNGNEELKQTTLDSLGLRSDTLHPNKCKFILRCEYIAPRTSDSDKKLIIESFEQKLQLRQAELLQQQNQQIDEIAAQIEADVIAAEQHDSGNTITTNDITTTASDTVSDVISNSTSASSIQSDNTHNNTPQHSGGDPAHRYDTSILPKPGKIRDDIPGVTIIAPTQFKQPLNTNMSHYTQSTTLNTVNNNTSNQNITIPVHRNRRIFHAPPGTVKVDDLPDEYFELTDDDIAIYARSLLSSLTLKNVNQSFIQQLHDASRPAKQYTDYNTTLIRFRLPNHMFIDSLFKSTETIGDMKLYLNNILHPDVLSTYYLYITPPRTKLDINKQTLRSHGLVNMCIVNVHIDTISGMQSSNDTESKMSVDEAIGHGILRDELLQSIVYLPRHDDTNTNTNNTNAPVVPNTIVPVQLD